MPSIVSLFASILPAADLAAPSLGSLLPLWTVLPFAALLLAIAVMPLADGAWWGHNKNKALVALVLGAPVAIGMGMADPTRLLHGAHEYVSFILLLGALYVISGGVLVRGTPAGTPEVNAIVLAAGAILASIVGTTGASMLLIRPLLRANTVRRRTAHIVVFFTFIVSNAGGMLTPIGDPPLFLGFLRGVPFFWTLHLLPAWALTNAVLIGAFYVVDNVIFRREDLVTPGDLDKQAVAVAVPLHVVGWRNLGYLGALVALVVACGSLGAPAGVQEAGLAALAALSIWTTPSLLRAENGFSWEPIVEVAVLFAGIFATMLPALAILNARGGELGLTEPWQLFWASGLLSSFLDNAPTYLTFTALASGLLGTDADHLGQLITAADGTTNVRGALLLTAISMGSVLMGANTYIGNGPNFMVKAIAERYGIRMPSFFGYMAWSGAVLVPIFVLLTFIFLR